MESQLLWPMDFFIGFGGYGKGKTSCFWKSYFYTAYFDGQTCALCVAYMQNSVLAKKNGSGYNEYGGYIVIHKIIMGYVISKNRDDKYDPPTGVSKKWKS